MQARAAQKALYKIKEKYTLMTCFNRGIKNSVAFGVGYTGMQILVKMETP